MKTKNTKAIMNVASEEQLAVLGEGYPTEKTFSRILLPRISFLAQDKTEGRGRNMVVTAEAGTFFTEKNVDGEWVKEEIGKEVELHIVHHRRQLRFWDATNESFINSPIYDSEKDIVPLFQDKKEIARGTQAELQAKYPPKEGRKTSSLEDERILYVLYKGEMYQMNIKGASKWAFFSYARKVNPATVITHITSEEKENGSVVWNQMLFTNLRQPTQEEVQNAILRKKELVEAIISEKEYYTSSSENEESKKAQEEFDNF